MLYKPISDNYALFLKNIIDTSGLSGLNNILGVGSR